MSVYPLSVELFDSLPAPVIAQFASQRGELPRRLVLGADAIERFAALLGKEIAGKRVALLFDERTYRAAGQECALALKAAGFSLQPLLIEDSLGNGTRHPPACDDKTKTALAARMTPSDVIVGVGSGVISDLSKWLAFEARVPAAVFGTAASMNGYAAANVAPAVDGVKTLVRARAHRIVAADPAMLAAAPAELTSAGLGDVIAKTVSTLDWKMNELLFGESYSAAIAGIVDHVQDRFLRDPERLAARDPDAVGGLFEALVYSGCAMTLQGSSLPASGGEHLISHALDMRAGAEGIAHDLHGRQVGVGTIFAAALFEAAFQIEAPRFRTEPLPFDREGWGSIADSVLPHYRKQSVRLAEASQRLASGDTWQRLRGLLSPMLPDPRWLKSVLSEAGAAHRIVDLGIDRERFTWALRNSAQMRERFTSIDLGWATGVLPDQADSIIDRFLVL
jgi:glycerol-1-phosphate dehydrogenase [NAD(P)+]